MAKKVGVGIIGTGFARKVQIPSFLQCENTFVASVASASLENAQATADEFGIGHLTDDWRSTITHPEVSLVCITTPPSLHKEMAIASLQAGKHVLCEKPMAMDATEAEAMTAAAANDGKLALLDHELRFQPGRQRAYEMLRDGAIGKVRHAKVVFQAPYRGDPLLPWNWWSDREAGGGALGAIASHVIDTLMWSLGTGISRVFCQLQTHIKERLDESGVARSVTTDDESNMLLRFPDGELTSDASGLVSISMTESPTYTFRTEFYGTEGSIRVEHRGELFHARGSEKDWSPIEVDIGRPLEGVYDTGFARGFLLFAPVLIDAISEKKSIPMAATFADGLGIQRVLDAARRSDDQGNAVEIQV